MISEATFSVKKDKIVNTRFMKRKPSARVVQAEPTKV